MDPTKSGYRNVHRPPIEVMEKWPRPNYINPVTRGPALIIVNAVLVPIALIIVGLRLYTRLRIVRLAGLDDIFIAVALIPSFGLTLAVCLAATRYGWNLHIWDVKPDVIMSSRKISWAGQMLFTSATSFTKISVLLFYKRFARELPGKGFLNTVRVALATISLYLVSCLVVIIFQCHPIASYWDERIKGSSCTDEPLAIIIFTIINTLTDFLVVLLPIPTVFKMNHLDRRQKWILSAILSLSGLVCLAGVARTVTLWILLHTSYDTTWGGYIAWVWTAVETYVGIICASIPALKPLFKHYFGSSHDSEVFERDRGWHIKEIGEAAETPSTLGGSQWLGRDDGGTASSMSTPADRNGSAAAALAMNNHIIQRDFSEEQERERAREQEHKLELGSYPPAMYPRGPWPGAHSYKDSTSVNVSGYGHNRV